GIRKTGWSATTANIHSAPADFADVAFPLPEGDVTCHILRLVRCVTLTTMALLGGVASAQAGVIYGLSSSTPGSLYTISSSTGAATLVTNLSGESFTSGVGLEARNGLLYATNVSVTGPATAFRFGTINPTTGAFTALNNQGGSEWHSLAYNPGPDLFYTV